MRAAVSEKVFFDIWSSDLALYLLMKPQYMDLDQRFEAEELNKRPVTRISHNPYGKKQVTGTSSLKESESSTQFWNVAVIEIYKRKHLATSCLIKMFDTFLW